MATPIRRRGSLAAVAVATAVTLSAAPTTAADAGSGPTGDPATSEKILAWAYPRGGAKIRRAPREDAPSRGRLRFLTEDGQPEVYLAERRTFDGSGEPWLAIHVLDRPNGRRGWVPEDSLGPLRKVETKLVIRRGKGRATLFKGRKRIWRAPIGVGQARWPTPRGRFYIRQRMRLRGGGGIYGIFAFGTSAYSSLSDWPRGGVVGIHGTNQPELIPGRISHGCVRVRNRDMRKLQRRMPIGTLVLVK